ncbi:hypothetical protein D3C80_1786980 [compost metagenome]
MASPRLVVLRLVQNLRNRVAGFQALQMLLGIGPKRAGSIFDATTTDPKPLLALAEVPSPPKTGDDLTVFTQMMVVSGKLRPFSACNSTA